MAFLAKTLSCFFLLVLISSPQIRARESKFFNQFTHISTENKVIPESQVSQAPISAPALAPTPETVPTIAAEPATATAPAGASAETPAGAPAETPADAPAGFYAESGNGYGLYGHGSGQFPPTKETVPSTNNENDLFSEELSAENYKTGYQNINYENNVYSSNYNNNNNNNGYNSNYNNNGYSSNHNTNGYVTEKQGMSDTRFMQNYRNNYYDNEHTSGNNYRNEYINGNNYYNNVYGRNYNNNGYTSNSGYTSNNNGYSSNYNTDNYETEKKGMSDTRFLDVKNGNDNFPNGFESERGTATNEGYHGNIQNANEFNAMEEFENQQEYQESPEKYMP